MKRTVFIPAVAAAVVGSVTLQAHAAFADTGGTLANGFTADVVAHSGQTINWAVDATGFDVGIYVGPGVHDVKIVGASVQHANYEGILVQDASNVVIRGTTVAGNSVANTSATPGATATNPYGLSELKGIVLAGSSDVTVTDNTVKDNNDGGIGLYDDGPSSPFAPHAIDSSPVPTTGNLVTRNLVQDNLNGCGIVVSEKDDNGRVSGNVVSYNTILGFGAMSPSADPHPGVGGIVLAGGSFGSGSVTDNVVLGNTVVGGFIPGISVHGSNGALIGGNALISNTLSNNGSSQGIQLAGAPGTIVGTQILNDTVTGDDIAVFHVGDVGTHIAHLSSTAPVVP